MYFWNIDDLVAELRTRAVTSADALAYLLVLLLPPMLMEALPGEPVAMTELDALLQVGLALVVLGGLLAAYRANGGAAGHDFAGRVLAVGWVMGVRLFVFWMIAIVAGTVAVLGLGAADIFALGEALGVQSIVWMLLFGWVLIHFWRVAHHLARAAQPGSDAGMF